MKVSVILPTRNPDQTRLMQVLAGLARQDLPPVDWELVIIDNASEPPLPPDLGRTAHAQARVVREPKAGLLWARAAGMRATTGEVLFFLDDDTVPAPPCLREIGEFMAGRAEVATAGGRILPSYAAEPPPWLDATAWALALRDWGDSPRQWAATDGGSLPNWTPIGAGLIVRRAAVPPYLDHVAAHGDTIHRLSWCGQGSGGNEDVDLVLFLLRVGWATAYAPRVELMHLIPAHRLAPAYLATLVFNLSYLWMRTLHAHGFDFIPPVTPATLPWRKLKAWFAFRAWRGMRERLDWKISCGRLEGLAANHREPFRYPAPPAKGGAGPS